MCRASRDGDLNQVQSLLDRGVPPDLPGPRQSSEKEKKHGMTPLLWASERGHAPVVKTLLKANAKLDATDPFSMTSLHWASARGHKDIVCLLVAAGLLGPNASANTLLHNLL
jgi:ankyrin repeat protein